jgi:hypothetical protein
MKEGHPMDANTYPLQDILKPERRYLIPTFQRDYEWTLEGQWRLLFEDLASTADRLLEVRSCGKEGASLQQHEKNVSPHFLGAIVCASLPFATGDVALRSVIDGQQRLTTIQLMIRGLADVLSATGSERTKSVRRMLFNPDDVVNSPEERYKLWPRRRDRVVWPEAIDDEVTNDHDADHPYLQARRFFAKSSMEYAQDQDGSVNGTRLVALADALSSLFKLVVIDLEDNDDAQVIFEVLNGRQTPLSAIDLVKNLLFMRAEFNSEDDVELLYEEHWSQFDDPWWKTTVGRGHAARGHRDVLLSAWLTAARGEEASVSHLYREARAYLEDGPSTEEVLRELSAFAVAYQGLYGQNHVADQRLKDSYQRIQDLDITTAIALLTWLGTLPSDRYSADEHVRAVRAIDSWAARRVYIGAQTRGYGSFLAKVLKDAKAAFKAGENVTNVIINALRDGGSLGWPTDHQVREAFLSRQFYNYIAQSRIRLLLGAIDSQLRAEDAHEPPASVTYADLQIEHVMPRSWGEHWPLLDQNGDPIVADENDPSWTMASNDRSRLVDRIGNLTLVTGSFNRAVSNLGWEAKQPEFQRQRSLVINYSIANCSSWDERNIMQRAEHLAEVALRVWPSPECLTI